MDLALWMVAADNPLTARVAVNRFWQQLFEVGLVKTSEDFGSQGESPSHPELLEFRSVEFVESGWDVKELMRTIVLSRTYRQSSAAAREQFVKDPANRLLARGSRFRLDAEVVRDQWLSTTGLLNQDLYEKSVKPPQPEGLWETVAMPSSYPNSYQSDSGDRIYRRSLYTFWKRSDSPASDVDLRRTDSRKLYCSSRTDQHTASGALLLMNEPQHFAAATQYAQTLLANVDLSDREKIALAYETVTIQEPSATTLDLLLKGLEDFKTIYTDDDPAKTELSSWTMLVHSILNLDITKTRE